MNVRMLLPLLCLLPIVYPHRILAQSGTTGATPAVVLPDLISHTRRHEVAEVKALLEAGTNPNVRDTGGNTALYWAVADGSQALIDLLLAHHADINARNGRGVTPLMNAAAGGEVDALARLMGPSHVPLDHLAISSSFQSVRVLARRKENTSGKSGRSVLRSLLTRGALVDPQDVDGRSALWWAVYGSDTEGARLLLARGANPNLVSSDGMTPLLMAVQSGRKEIAQLLLAHPVDVEAHDKEGRTALWIAESRGDAALAEALLAKRADVNTHDRDNKTLLMLAVERGDLHRVKRLVALHANVHARDKQGRTALLTALARRDLPLVQALLAAGADVNAWSGDGTITSVTPLWYTLRSPEMLLLLLAHGANIEVKDRQGRTPLWAAAIDGNAMAVKTLLERGARVEGRDPHGLSVLMIAAEYGRTDCVKLLLDHNADIAARDETEQTVLHWAVALDTTSETVSLLLTRGANIDVRDRWGHTPLMAAIRNGCPRLARLLIERGANLQLRDDEGNTALNWAVNTHQDQIAERLKATNTKP